MITAFAAGFGLGFSLIVAIGAQNAFVLRQGIIGAHVFAVCLICATSDAILITLGVGGFSHLIKALPWAEPALRALGVAFLSAYGMVRFRSALAGGKSLEEAQGAAPPLAQAVATCLALTWLNPHVWLDTVVLLGSVSARYQADKLAFGLGAAIASFTFFFALGYGARLMRGLFKRPRAWQVLDFAIAAIMWTIAVGLLVG